MNIKYTKLSLAIVISLALSACGSGSTATPSTPLNGKVIDGYISGATVFLDKNRNLALDNGEPFDLSDNEGAYSLSLSETDIAALPTSPVVVFVGAGAKDIDTGEEFTEDNDFVLTSPPILNFKPEQAESFFQAITPFTTQLYNEVKDTLELVVSGDFSAGSLTLAITAAESKILMETAATLGIDTGKLQDLLFNDFLEQTGEVTLEPAELQALVELAMSVVDDLQENKAIEDALASTLEDNQEVNVNVSKYSFIEWHTGETLRIKEVSKEVITTQENGDKVIESQATKYRLNKDGSMTEVAGEPLIYEIVFDTTREKADGTFEAEIKYEIDKNGDNTRLFKGQSYRLGTRTTTSREFTEYFDESKLSIELPELTWADDNSYQGSNIKAAVLAENYADIDFIQHKIESKVSEDGNMISTLAFEHFDSLDGVFNLAQANYAETRIDIQSATGILHEVKKDWDADNSINEYIADEVFYDGTSVKTTANPIWENSHKSGDWQELDQAIPKIGMRD